MANTFDIKLYEGVDKTSFIISLICGATDAHITLTAPPTPETHVDLEDSEILRAVQAIEDLLNIIPEKQYESSRSITFRNSLLTWSNLDKPNEEDEVKAEENSARFQTCVELLEKLIAKAQGKTTDA